MGSLERLTKDTKELQTDFSAEESMSSSLRLPLVSSVVAFLSEHVEGGNYLLLKDADFFCDKAQEHRVLLLFSRLWREGIFERDYQLAGLRQFVGVKTLVDGPRHVHHLEHLIKVLLLVLLPVEVVCDQPKVNVFAAKSSLKFFHGFVRLHILLSQLCKHA